MKKHVSIVAAAIVLAALTACATTGGGGEGLSLEEGIERSAAEIAAELPAGTIVAVVGFSSEQQNLSLYIADELSGALVEAGLTLADRRNLDYVYEELKFQMTGDVSDETAVSIGQFVGARYVITGQLVNAGNAYRLRLAGINAETAVQESSIRLNIRDDRNFRMLLAGVQSPQAVSARNPAGEEEYTIYFSGSIQGTVSIQRDRAGKITLTPRVTGSVYGLDRETCPLIPAWVGIVVFSDRNVTDVIEGNTWTTTWSDGSWYKTVVNGNTTTYTHSNGRWSKRVVNGNTTTYTNSDGDWDKEVVDGNTTTTTRSNGWWYKTVVNGNTTTYTNSDGDWSKTVVNGNTRTYTNSDGDWYKEVVDGNTTTTTWSDGMWWKEVVDGNTTTTTNSDGYKEIVEKQGHDIFITYESGGG
jgi:TolB-like protein